MTVWLFQGNSNRQTAIRLCFILLVFVVFLMCGICTVAAVRWIGKPFPGFFVNQRMAVGIMGLPHWTGTQAGLKYPDKIVKANLGEISSKQELEAVVRRVNVGEHVHYTLEREGQIFEASVQTMRFSSMDLFMTFGIVAFLGLVYFAMGAVIFIFKPGSAVGQVFLLACTLQGISSIVSFDIEGTHLGFIRVWMLCEALLPAVVIHLSFLFPEKHVFMDKRPSIAAVPYIPSIFLFVALQISYPKPPFLSLFRASVSYFTISVALFLISVVRAFIVQRGSVLARERAKVILIGAVLAMPVPALVPLVSIMGGAVAGTRIPTNLSSIPMIMFPFSIAYAIARHNLFDVDVFIKRAVGYAIMTAVVGAAYLGLQVGLESVIIAPVFGSAAWNFTPVLFAILVVFLFNPLNRRVQDAVDRMFYRKKFDYKETVLSVSNALSSVLDLKEIVRKVVHTVRDTMYIDTSGLVLAGAQGETLRGHFIGDAAESRGGGGGSDRGGGAGAERDVEREVSIPSDDPLVLLVARERKMITKYDVAEDPRFANERVPCGKRFEELGASLAVPLVHKGEFKGILTVGHKKSGHFFTREDIDLIQTLASHGAVAIENANLADQMKKEETVRTNLSRYLSPQIVDRIVKDDVKVNLGGDRKVVTVLFSDIRNFTTITETRPPDQLVAILNEYFTEMAQIIFDHQGSLDKYIGDAIVAVFGSLIPVENPARNAVQASLHMMKRLPILNEKWMKQYDFSMNIGIGVNTGEVFLGNIGSPERMEFTVIGDAVNVASRFSGLAKPGQILVTRDTLAMLGPDVKTHALPSARVKGKSEILEVYEILGAD